MFVLVAVFNFFSVSMNSLFELLCLVNTSIKGHVKKKNEKKCFGASSVPFPLSKGNAGSWNEIVKTE